MTDREMLELCYQAFEAIAVQQSRAFMAKMTFPHGGSAFKGKTISQQLAAAMQRKLIEHHESKED